MRLFKKKEKIEVYCQDCGKDLTNIGGDIANNKKIYCNTSNRYPFRCIDNYLLKNPDEGILIANYSKPEEIQKAIRKRKLVHYNKLEKSVSE
jgi:hypothetical protein